MNRELSAGASTTIPQYSLWRILGIWALAAVPMGLLAWVLYPALAPRVSINPGIFLWILMIIGLIWQVILSALILYRENGTLRPKEIRRSTWRQQPRDPKTGEPSPIRWLWLLPALAITAVLSIVLASGIQKAWTTLIPIFTPPSGYELQELTSTPEKWVGAWYLVGIVYSWPSRRFRCAWFGVILHGTDGLFFMFVIFSLVLGLT
jgi:hypothetical protein